MSTDYETIEQMLAGILADLSGILSDAEQAEVDGFILVGEYGVALETLAALLVEECKPLPPPVFERIVELAEVMNLRESVATDDLRERVRAFPSTRATIPEDTPAARSTARASWTSPTSGRSG